MQLDRKRAVAAPDIENPETAYIAQQIEDEPPLQLFCDRSNAGPALSAISLRPQVRQLVRFRQCIHCFAIGIASHGSNFLPQAN